MFTVASYISSIKNNLQKNTNQLVENIKEALDFNYFTGIELVDCSVFMQSFDLSIMLYSMDRTANEVFHEDGDPSVFSGSHELFGEVRYYTLAVDKVDAFYEFYERNDMELEEAEKQVVVEWFVACWKEANGQRLKLPAYFGFHDDVKSLDLHEDKWVSEEAKWSS